MAKGKKTVAVAPVVAAPVVAPVAAAPAGALADALKGMKDNDKEAAQFFLDVTDTEQALSEAVKLAKEEIWSGAAVRYCGAGFTWAAVEEIAPALCKRKAYTSTKAIIIAAIGKGVALVDEGGKARGKGTVHLETQAAELGIDAAGKTQKVLAAEIKAAKAANEGGEGGNVGNNGETVEATPEQIIRAAFLHLKMESALLLQFRREIGACVLALAEIDKAKIHPQKIAA